MSGTGHVVNDGPFTVTCQDGQVRHQPFEDLHDALSWAEWGHACTNRHVLSDAVDRAVFIGPDGCWYVEVDPR